MDFFLFACDHYLWFVVYSIAGWIWETMLFRVTEGKFVKRGFLYGPFCPIYGAGAVLFWLTLQWVPQVFQQWIPHPVGAFFAEAGVLFLLGGLMACILEYFTSAILEHCFHTRWWDYYRNRFNLKGRVSLLGFCSFGAFAVGLVLIGQPFVVWVTNAIPDWITIVAAIATGVWLLLDFIFTLIRVIRKRQAEDRAVERLVGEFPWLDSVQKKRIRYEAETGALYFETVDWKEFLQLVQEHSELQGKQEVHKGQGIVQFSDGSGRSISAGEPMKDVIQRFLEQGMTMKEIAQATGVELGQLYTLLHE